MYVIQLKVPFAGRAILPRLDANIVRSPETEKLRTKRENVLTRLEAVVGATPSWDSRKYCYTMDNLTPEQITEIESWEYVRHVKEVT